MYEVTIYWKKKQDKPSMSSSKLSDDGMVEKLKVDDVITTRNPFFEMRIGEKKWRLIPWDNFTMVDFEEFERRL